MSTTITGLTLASVLGTVGCAQAIARHDLFERSDSRIGRIGDRARQDSNLRPPA